MKVISGSSGGIIFRGCLSQSAVNSTPATYAICVYPYHKPSDRMPGQKTISEKRKQTESSNSRDTKRARVVDEIGDTTTSRSKESLLTSEDETSEEDTFERPRMPRRETPIEVWWNVIDELQNDQDALVACALVCKGWAPRSMRLLGKPITLRSPRHVLQIAKLGRTGSQEVKSCRTVIINGNALRTLSVFATRFAGKMPCSKTLLLQGTGITGWKLGDMHVDIFHYLSTFASITHLSLSFVTFPSVQTFGRLVSALPSVTSLRRRTVKFKTHGLRAGTFLRRPRNLSTLELDIYDLPTTRDVSDLLVRTEMASSLKKIIIRWPIELDELDKSGIPALISSAGTSLHGLHLTLDSPPITERAHVIDFGNLSNLRNVCFAIWPEWDHDEDILPNVMPWLCDQLAGLSRPWTALRDFTLKLPLGTRCYPEDSAARHRSYVQHCKLLDDLLSTPPFMGKMGIEGLAPTRFPKLAARGVFR